MYSAVKTGVVQGVKARVLQVEVNATQGLPCFAMVGSLAAGVKEASERVRVAMKNAGFILPAMHITVNIAPADERKDGAGFDLPIAVGLMIAMDIIRQEQVAGTLVIGELGLDGDILPVKGILPIARMAKEMGIKRIVVPYDNAAEAAVVEGVEVYGLENLDQIQRFFSGSLDGERAEAVVVDRQKLFADEWMMEAMDYADINGQFLAKRAMEIAAAGFHHVLMIGPPGAGKTMLAKRMATILPPLSEEESLEVSSIYSIAGQLDPRNTLITRRPFLDPHHTITEQAMAGGGRIPKPGVISLAHRGVLFLDELPEFKRSVLEMMRQPLEDRQIYVARNSGTYIFPSSFLLCAAMNPCPCGYFPDSKRCTCSDTMIRKYRAKISGPILDRIDLCVPMDTIGLSELRRKVENETSREIAARVANARQMQERRFEGSKYQFNSEIVAADMERYCYLDESGQQYMEDSFRVFNMSARQYHRVIRLARTIADLEQSEMIQTKHLTEAMCYRMPKDFK